MIFSIFFLLIICPIACMHTHTHRNRGNILAQVKLFVMLYKNKILMVVLVRPREEDCF